MSGLRRNLDRSSSERVRGGAITSKNKLELSLDSSVEVLEHGFLCDDAACIKGKTPALGVSSTTLGSVHWRVVEMTVSEVFDFSLIVS